MPAESKSIALPLLLRLIQRGSHEEIKKKMTSDGEGSWPKTTLQKIIDANRT